MGMNFASECAYTHTHKVEYIMKIIITNPNPSTNHPKNKIQGTPNPFVECMFEHLLKIH